MKRTAQDILAERRANCLELARETDRTARAMLTAHIASLDVELREVQAPAPRTTYAAVLESAGVRQYDNGDW